jgi:hypothetical protein
MSDTIYTEGMRIFAPRNEAPDFVKGTIIITPNELFKFFKDQEEHKTEYNGETQFRLQLLEGRNGLYTTLDTYKPQNNEQNKEVPVQEPNQDDLPF